MTTYYNVVLPQEAPVFDGYAFIVGTARPASGRSPSSRCCPRRTCRPAQPAPGQRCLPLGGRGAAHSGWEGREYRIPLEIRDFGAETIYTCTNPPFSRVWLSQVIEAAYGHLARWVDGGAPPGRAVPEFSGPTTRHGMRSDWPSAASSCRRSPPTALEHRLELGAVVLLFGTHVPFSDAQLASLYRNHGSYVSGVRAVDRDNEAAGFLIHADALENLREAALRRRQVSPHRHGGDRCCVAAVTVVQARAPAMIGMRLDGLRPLGRPRDVPAGVLDREKLVDGSARR